MEKLAISSSPSNARVHVSRVCRASSLYPSRLAGATPRSMSLQLRWSAGFQSPILQSRKEDGPPLPLPACLSSSRDFPPADCPSPCSGSQFAVKIASEVLLFTLAALLLTRPVYASVQSGKILSTELTTSAWTGFFAGCLHTLSGPDHLAALAPLAIGRTRLESAAVGALWGCGHDAGQVLFGLIFLALKDRLHIEIIRTWGTRVVAVTLFVIGVMGIREASESHSPCVKLENGECDVSDVDSLQTMPLKKKKVGFATFATGIVHGLQPDALMMVLPALALPSRLAGAAFLGMFLVGTVFAMGSYTVFIGSCSQALQEKAPRVTEKLTIAASLVAIFMGTAILVSQWLGFNLY